MGKMNKIFISLATILFLSSPLFSKTQDIIFSLAQQGACYTIDLDTFLTYDAIWNYDCQEKNPIVRQYVDNMYITLAIDRVVKYVIVRGTSKIYKHNKILGWIAIISVYAIQTFALYHHYEVRRNR